GGLVRLAARLPERRNFLEVVRFLAGQLAKLGVDVRLGREVDPGAVRAEAPEAGGVATGTRPGLPGPPGGGGGLVQVEDVVAGRARVGRRVLVVDADGHLRGCGTADLLASQGRQVAIAAETLHAGQNIDMKTLYPLYRRLRERGVELLPSTRFEGWEDGRPVVGDVFTGARRRLDADTVVWAGPGAAEAALVEPLRDAGLAVQAVGDCVAPRRVEHAVHEAHAVARAL